MSRIPYPAAETLSTETENLLSALGQLNIFKMLANAPHTLKPVVGLATVFLTKGLLDPIDREIAILRVGYLSNACLLYTSPSPRD